VYLDDILIFSRTQEEHEEHLALVLERLRQFELYANPEKCEFYKQEVEFLGFIVNTTGIKMDPKRVDTITAWRTSRPQTYRDIQVFLGFCIFCRRFIYGFSGIARPSHELLRESILPSLDRCFCFRTSASTLRPESTIAP